MVGEGRDSAAVQVARMRKSASTEALVRSRTDIMWKRGVGRSRYACRASFAVKMPLKNSTSLQEL